MITSTFSGSAFSDCDADVKGGVLSEFYVKYLLITAGEGCFLFCLHREVRGHLELETSVLLRGSRKV